jgi:hypothetical protein
MTMELRPASHLNVLYETINGEGQWEGRRTAGWGVNEAGWKQAIKWLQDHVGRADHRNMKIHVSFSGGDFPVSTLNAAVFMADVTWVPKEPSPEQKPAPNPIEKITNRLPVAGLDRLVTKGELLEALIAVNNTINNPATQDLGSTATGDN